MAFFFFPLSQLFKGPISKYGGGVPASTFEFGDRFGGGRYSIYNIPWGQQDWTCFETQRLR